MIMFASNIKVIDDLESDYYDIVKSTNRIVSALEQLSMSLDNVMMRHAFANLKEKIRIGHNQRKLAKFQHQLI